jgi:hypothetical protein
LYREHLVASQLPKDSFTSLVGNQWRFGSFWRGVGDHGDP